MVQTCKTFPDSCHGKGENGEADVDGAFCVDTKYPFVLLRASEKQECQMKSGDDEQVGSALESYFAENYSSELLRKQNVEKDEQL